MAQNLEKYKLAATSVLILVLSIYGWGKLKYGISFIDEGMYLTDAWRLSAGDSFFPDNDRFFGTFYSIFTSVTFQFFPDISILQLRRLALVISWAVLLNLVFFGANYLKVKKYYLLIALWPMFYTGLDTVGMTSSLNYYTTPSIFFAFYTISLLKLSSIQNDRKSLWSFISGIFFFLCAASYFPAAITIVAFLLFLKSDTALDKLKRFGLFVSPCMGFLLIIHPNYSLFVQSLSDKILSSGTAPLLISGFSTQTCAIALGLVLLYWTLIREAPPSLNKLFSGAILATLIYFFIFNGWFGTLPNYWRGWFNYPGRIASLMAVVGLFSLAIELSSRRQPFDPPAVILVNYLLFSMAMAMTSGLGLMTFLYGAPVLMLYLVKRVADAYGSCVIIFAASIPIGYALCWHDYNFTYFDRAPHDLRSLITSGRAAGIYTNEINHSVIESIEQIVSENSRDNEYILSFDQTAMAYFLTSRRPAVDHSWIGILGADSSMAIEEMKSLNRNPTVALHWRNKFLWFPESGDIRKTSLGSSSDSGEKAVLDYVKNNMTHVGDIEYQGEAAIQVFIAR